MASLTTSSHPRRRLCNTLVVDSGPILSSAAAPTFYLTAADRILTTPSVLSEIRDEAARSRFDTIWRPFLTVRAPKPESVKFVAEFAKKTGDYPVLSAVDLGLLALTYEVELEVAGGDWRLRKAPGQKELNGPLREGWGWEGEIVKDDEEEETEEQKAEEQKTEEQKTEEQKDSEAAEPKEPAEAAGVAEKEATATSTTVEEASTEEVAEKLEQTHLSTPSNEPEITTYSDSSDDDSDGWITPSNLHKHKAAANNSNLTGDTSLPTQKLPVALATSDFAMQNVLLQFNLHLLSPSSLQRITHTRSTVLRCHACFYIIRHPSQKTTTDFCPRCGGLKTLLRTTCSTTPDGGFQIHLKKNFQYRNRGNVYSLPKPKAGTSSMKGVADAPVLREDQKEYQRAVKWESYRKEKDLLDQDSLPNILSGERRRGSAIRIGVGRRNPNEPRRGGGRRKK